LGSIDAISWRAFLPMVLIGIFFAYSSFEFFSSISFYDSRMSLIYLFSLRNSYFKKSHNNLSFKAFFFSIFFIPSIIKRALLLRIKVITTKKESLKFLWLFVVTEQTKDPQVTNVIAPYLTKQNLIMLIILFSLFIFYLKKNENKILQMRNTLFLSLLEFSISREIICLLSYNLIYLRGLFETQAKIIVYSIAFPGILSAFDQYFHWVPLFDNPYFMCCFFCTLGVSLAILDSLGMEISAIIEKYPQHPFSIAFSQFLLKKRKSDILARGFFTKLGTLTATGQAALFAGALAAIGTISTTWINTRSLERVTRENNKHDAEQKAEQRKHDAEQKAEQRKHDAEQKAEQRKHDAEQKAEHRKYKENKQKNQFNENEAARQHEREKWTREDQQHSAYDANLKNSSWWKQN
jgi:hypothetical protein